MAPGSHEPENGGSEAVALYGKELRHNTAEQPAATLHSR